MDSATAYRQGLCIDCREVKYSAGRPRCEACHTAWTNRSNPAPPFVIELHLIPDPAEVT